MAMPGATLSPVTIRAHVRDGWLFIDETTNLPDETEIELLPLAPGDGLDDRDRAALHDALRQSKSAVADGRLISAEEILKELRAE